MKKQYRVFILITSIIVTLIAVGFIPKHKPAKAVGEISPKGFAVVELFTSEGCSSCPAADEAIARLLAKNISNVFILSYHVDYWDRLGWKDPFSNAGFSQRQNQYASVFDLSSVYTPQAIVNGSTQLVGSDEEKLANTVKKNLLEEPTRHLTIDTKRSGNQVLINYDIDGKEGLFLNLALVQPEATTSVKKGENGGRTLHHVNVVRALKTIDANGRGSFTMEIPKEITTIPLLVIAYLQEKKSFQVVGAEQKSL